MTNVYGLRATMPPLPKMRQIDRTHRQLEESYVYVTARGCPIVVPRGFVSDGASSPFRALITSWGGHYAAAALIHDYLYDCLNRGAPHPCGPTRKDADRVLREEMARSGVRPLVRLGIWLAVRAFGGPALRRLGVR
jgi:hypothetical protein